MDCNYTTTLYNAAGTKEYNDLVSKTNKVINGNQEVFWEKRDDSKKIVQGAVDNFTAIDNYRVSSVQKAWKEYQTLNSEPYSAISNAQARLDALSQQIDSVLSEAWSQYQELDKIQLQATSKAKNQTDFLSFAWNDLTSDTKTLIELWAKIASQPNNWYNPSTKPEQKAGLPLIGIIDTGFQDNNPDVNSSRITFSKSSIINSDELGNGHGANVLETIAATRNNGIGIDGINDRSPIWLASFKGSANWAQTLVEFVDAAIASKQPNAVINLSFDLTQIFADGSVGNRYELTPIERAALTYAQQNQVLIVATAGNQDGLLSALGKAAKEFNNILVVGAADGLNRANYSNYDYSVDYAHYGKGVDLLAQGTAANGAVGTSIAAAKVTGAASLVWAANPGLNYAQVLNILRYTATDVNTPGWDAETGVGLLNISAAVNLAAATQPQSYSSPNLDAIQTAFQDQGIPKAAWTKFYQFAYYQELEAKLTGQSWSAVDAVASEREAGLLGKVVNVVVDNVVKPVFSVFTPAPTQWGDSKPSGGGGLLGSLIKDIKEISKVVDGENLAKAALALRQGDPINAFYKGLSLVDGVSELVDTFKYLKDGNAKKAVPSLITAAPKLAKLFSDL